jgi:hypothetical protein
MSKIQITYTLSEKGRKVLLLQGGDGKANQVVEADITPELLERATVRSDGSAHWRIEKAVTDAKIVGTTISFSSYRLDVGENFYEDHRPRIETGYAYSVFFDEPQTVESLLAYMESTEAKLAARMAELEKQLPEKVAAWERAVAEHKEKARAVAERETAEKAERERREQERTEWIAAHGSEYLRRATALKYDCQRRYVAERAALELSDYEVDFDNNASWKSRACPSEEALAEVEELIQQGYNVEVVWLTKPVQEPEYDYEDSFEQCEAIAVHEYLGKYDAVKVL